MNLPYLILPLCSGLFLAWACRESIAGQPIGRGHRGVEAPVGLPGIPEGVNLGMTVQQIRKARPRARPMVSPFGESWTKESGQLLFGALIENLGRQPQSGDGACVYAFEEGECVGISVEYRVPSADLPRRREKLVEEYLARLGVDCSRAVRVVRGASFPYDAPCLTWKVQDAMVVLSPTPDFPGTSPDQGVIYIRVDLGSHIEGMGMTSYNAAEHKPLFAAIDDLICSFHKALPKKPQTDSHLVTARNGFAEPPASSQQPSQRVADWLHWGVGTVAVFSVTAVIVALLRKKRRSVIVGRR